MRKNSGTVDGVNYFEVLFCQNGKMDKGGLTAQTIDNNCLISEET
jgi:hypothetical protein